MKKHIKNWNKQLLTVLVLNNEPSERIMPSHITELINIIITKYNGKLATYNKILTASFKGPTSAVDCGLELIKRVQNTNISIGVGVHIFEMPAYEGVILSQEVCTFINAFLEKINHGQILITETVKQLIARRGLFFTEQYKSFIFLADKPVSLFTVSDTNLLEHHDLFNYQLPQSHALIALILQYIDQHMDKGIGVNMICDVVGISRRHLQRRVKVITNMSPNQFVNFIKLNHAKELLQRRDLSIAEVAFSIGLNPSYFSKKFKKEFGVNPSDI